VAQEGAITGETSLLQKTHASLPQTQLYGQERETAQAPAGEEDKSQGHTQIFDHPGEGEAGEKTVGEEDVAAIIVDDVEESESIDELTLKLWKQALENAFEESGGIAVNIEKLVEPRHYVKRLVHLQQGFQRLCENSESKYSSCIVHIEPYDTGFRVHRTRYADESGRQDIFCIGCHQSIEDAMLFQVFLLVETTQGNNAWVLLPLGSFAMEKYPRGYQRLLTDMPDSICRLTTVRNPARLCKEIGKANDFYRVAVKMQVGFAQ
jgi:hypothetical protein